MERCICDMHTHTFLCGHAEIVLPRMYHHVGDQLGYKAMAFCCHNPFPGDNITRNYRMAMSDFSIFLKLYENEKAFCKQHFPDLKLLLAMEVDWVPDDHAASTNFVEKYLKGFDYVIGSLHFYECIGVRRPKTSEDPNLDFVRKYYSEWCLAFESGVFQIMAHMDFFKVITGIPWARRNIDKTLPIIQAALERFRDNNKRREKQGLEPIVIEVNTGAPQYGDDFLPSDYILRVIVGMNIPICISSDCHQAVEVGRYFGTALQFLKEIGFTELCYFEKRKLYKYSIDKAIATLQKVDVPVIVSRGRRDRELSADVEIEMVNMLTTRAR